MRQPMVAGNWKMNGSTESIKTLLSGIKAGMAGVKTAKVVTCAPAIYLPLVATELEGSAIGFGGEDISTFDSGAYTGEISAAMYQDFNCQYVIVGHSERRTYHNESDELVAQKFAKARSTGLIPLFCIGETLQEREEGITEQVVARQIQAVIDLEGVEALADGVIAYEPVWAIGTGVTASPEQAQEVHAFIRNLISQQSSVTAEKIQILYGGSMNPKNANELLAKADIDGGLIGGASLKADDFLAICTAANA